MSKDITAEINAHIKFKGYWWTDQRNFTFPQSIDGSIGIVIDGKGFTQCADIDDVIETLINMNYTSGELAEVVRETERERYLSKFKRENSVEELGWGASETVGNQIVELLKKEGLTYDQAYASLQFAYNKIKYESNFLKLS